MEKKTINKELSDENGIEIDSVSSFIGEVNRIKDGLSGGNTEIFFRGQKTEFWDVKPSVFRDNLLSAEHMLMQAPLLKAPYEFSGISNDFEIMTKYQHYGMCTRLLDLTTNPLVALYFACETYGNVLYQNEEGDEEKEPYGVVFFNNEYPSTAKDRTIRIISSLSQMDLTKDNTLDKILDHLFMHGVITDKEKSKWISEHGYEEFVNIIQNNYIVSPSYSNERLSRQSGMFLLAGCFNFNYLNPISKSTIEKGHKNLRDAFNEDFFYISGDKKQDILSELDTYNINEATLFPELEHQLNYIKEKRKTKVTSVSEFVKYNNEPRRLDNVDYSDEIKDDLLVDGVFEDIVFDKLQKEYPEISKSLLEEIKSCVRQVDWFNQISIISGLKVGIRKQLKTIEIGTDIDSKVDGIVNMVIEVAKRVSKKE